MGDNLSTDISTVAITKEVREARNNYIINLRISGCSVPTIVRNVNLLAVTKGWGAIKEPQVSHILNNYHKENTAIFSDLIEKGELLRADAKAFLEMNLEKLAYYIQAKDKAGNWKPFEAVEARKELHNMRIQLAELEGVSLNGKNQALGDRSTINMYVDARKELLNSPPAAVQEFMDRLDGVIDSLPVDEDAKVKNDIHDI